MTQPSLRVVATLLAVVTAMGGWAAEVERASACSGFHVPPTDPSVEAVVAGRVTGIAYEEQHPPNQLEPIDLDVTVEVGHYLMGSGPGTVTISDMSSATGDTDQITWQGLCAAFREDPTGQYVVLAVLENPRDFNMFALYGIGKNAQDGSVPWGLNWVTEQLQATGVTPASAGHGVEDASTPWGVLGLGVLAVGLLAGARQVSRR